MENASKALLIAAAVLIAIILITVGIKIFSSTSDTQKVAMSTGDTIKGKTTDATGLAISEITGKNASNAINYGSKTKETIEPGDDITIGGTEKFKVFSVGAEGIKAMPYYNIELKLDNPKQSSIAENITFASRKYWNTGANSIEMENHPENNIWKYILAYQTTLNNMGIDNVTVKNATKNELDSSNITSDMLNPGGEGSYWTSSSYLDYGLHFAIYTVFGNGSFYTTYYYSTCGVRPIIIISL